MISQSLAERTFLKKSCHSLLRNGDLADFGRLADWQSEATPIGACALMNALLET